MKEYKAISNLEPQEFVLAVKQIQESKDFSLLKELIPKELKAERLSIAYSLIINSILDGKTAKDMFHDDFEYWIRNFTYYKLTHNDFPKYVRAAVKHVKKNYFHGLFEGKEDKQPLTNEELANFIGIGAATMVGQMLSRPRMSQARLINQLRIMSLEHTLGNDFRREETKPPMRSIEQLKNKPRTGCPVHHSGVLGKAIRMQSERWKNST